MTRKHQKTAFLVPSIWVLVVSSVFFVLGNFGASERSADILPGEDIEYSDTEDQLHDWLSYRGAPQELSEEETRSILKDLRVAAERVYPCVAEIAVQIRPLENDRKAHEYPIARFQLEAQNKKDWYSSEMRSRGSLFVQHNDEGMFGGVPWQQNVYATPASAMETGGGPLTPGAEIFTEENLVGYDEEMNVVHFTTSAKEDGVLRMFLAVDRDTAVVKRAEALLEVKMSTHEAARRFVAVQVVENWTKKDAVETRKLREGTVVRFKPDGTLTPADEKR